MEQTISVSQLAFYIKNIFEAEELLYNISVVGEVSGLKIVRGIAYFDIKDEAALISCVCFNGHDLDNTKNGDKIIAKGTPGFYVKGGKLNFNVCKISPVGVGELFQKFLALKEKLLAEGLFDESHKKQLPTSIKTVGVITSQTGAVIHDIITVAARRNKALNIVLYPAKVQGAGTAQSIINGLDYFENMDKLDAVIIARGGGSAEDLWEFNDETLARRVYSFSKPIISAVGHETDFTICDFAADIRAATPSAAAELVSANMAEKQAVFLRQVTLLKARLISFMLDNESENATKTQIIADLIKQRIKDYEYAINLKALGLQKFDPNAILALGYAKVLHKSCAVTSSKALNKGDQIVLQFKDGTAKGEIK